jgi:hypothetical protein
MKQSRLSTLLSGVLASHQAIDVITNQRPDIQPFKVDLTKDVPRLLELVNQTQLPEHEEYPGVGASFGIDLSVLKGLQQEWSTSFDWEKEEASINRSVTTILSARETITE